MQEYFNDIYKYLDEFKEIINIGAFNKLSFSDGNIKLKLKKRNKQIQLDKKEEAPILQESQNKEIPEKLDYIKSKYVGIFTFSDIKLKVSDKIKKGDVIGYVNTLNITNKIISDKEGYIKEILIKDNSIVEYGQNILILKESSDV